MKIMKAALIAIAISAPLTMARAETQDIVEVAVGAGNLKTLVAAVKAADLVETLKGKGPFTVFAPTDDAFAKLPKDTIDDLLKPQNRAKLAKILTYHVVPGKITASDIKGKKTNVKTVEGSKLAVDSEKGVRVNNAKVVEADIIASNGVIHVIDTVLMPKM
jgi:uncharacterized surface protein with fasciclin (FAS1) repeats